MSSFHEDSVRVSMMVKSYAHLNRRVIFLMQVSSSNKTRLGKPWETFKPRFFFSCFFTTLRCLTSNHGMFSQTVDALARFVAEVRVGDVGWKSFKALKSIFKLKQPYLS